MQSISTNEVIPQKILGLMGKPSPPVSSRQNTCKYMRDHIIAELNNHLKMVLNIYTQCQFSLFSLNFLKKGLQLVCSSMTEFTTNRGEISFKNLEKPLV